jgi:heme/copper-type cytochrome/quinol oxidase subunit 1
LLYLVGALVIGVLLVARTVLTLPDVTTFLGPVYFHLFLVGWVTQLIIGVAYWMFPKYSRDKPRASETLAWVTLILLNVGLLTRAVSEPLQALRPGSDWGWALAVSAVLQWLAGMAFVTNTWVRVKER